MRWNNIELPDKNIYFQDDDSLIYCADCRGMLPSLKGISAVITDPPYELGFMGKSWDSKGISFQPDTWRLIREACLPGAMLLSFGGTRTSHRIACAIEDAGWQIRDTIMWVYGSGFPKSLSIGKQIDKKAGAKRKVIGSDKTRYRRDNKNNNTYAAHCGQTGIITQSATPEAKLWEGYGTALKPAYEPILVCMNPLDGTFADNALKHKVAGLNIDECRIATTKEDANQTARPKSVGKIYKSNTYGNGRCNMTGIKQGRFPANFLHDGSQEVMELFPQTQGAGNIQKPKLGDGGKTSVFGIGGEVPYVYDRGGSAARFYYVAKASRRERYAGLEDMPERLGIRSNAPRENEDVKTKPTKNNHPTVKPLALMTYLCKLVKMPEYNLILDPFCGSGTTLLACKKLGIKAIGIDSSEEYCEIAKKRLSQSVMKLE